PPGVRETNRRAAYARALLETNLPKTIAKITDREVQGVRFAPPSYFFSRVASEAATENQRDRVRLLRGDDGGWELDYSADEYLALLERLRTIATDAGDWAAHSSSAPPARDNGCNRIKFGLWVMNGTSTSPH